VGAVIVNDGRLVGRGYHTRLGAPHAEVEAIAAAGSRAAGGTIYVTLEPCNHYGRTPPCTEAIVKAGLRRVVVGMPDPNPSVIGGGAEHLIEHGLEVTQGVLESACRELNCAFIKHVTTGMPYVTVKAGVTLDGKIATFSGQSKWVTSVESRGYVHQLRHGYDAIMVGRGTVAADNPDLTTRLPFKMPDQVPRNPLRVVVDSQLSLPIDIQVFTNLIESRTVLACAGHPNPEKERQLREMGVTLICTSPDQRRVDLKALLMELARMGVSSVLVEGGGELNWSLFSQGLVDKVMFFLAPKIIGGKDAVSVVAGMGFENMAAGVRLGPLKITRLERDILVEAEVLRESGAVFP
ncbi:MAG: bifunctional diaminohydroxyphosphoribosylaminopyrimidine deaminase/5-amino-6-(5-phosphoribosylamino)uracil reductase RibD, partial [Deltaproteobacteria bacterium]|nr:bifunctional diaminohydroxyphosphoribosylaminopyrimidine deaminase/5-amino-6-(5-phosphoribosylamino)uracil reductase RibD [Deltaproteobacteria bacterium]